MKKPMGSPLVRAEIRQKEEKEADQKRMTRFHAGEAEAASKRPLLEKFKVGDIVTNGKKFRGEVIGIDFNKGCLRVRLRSGKVFSWRPDFVTLVPREGKK